MGLIIVLLVVLVIYMISGIKVVNQYERGIILTLGKYTGRSAHAFDILG